MEHTKLPLVSVVITTFNASKYLKETLDSIKKQTHKNTEIIVVDDGSTDNTKEILGDFKDSHPEENITINLSSHIGRINALNKGISLCSGSYIAICDADDVFSQKKIEVQVSILNKDKNLGFCGTNGHYINSQSRKISGPPFMKVFSDEEIRKNIIKYNPFIHSSVVYRKSALTSTNPYSDKFIPGFEWEIYINIMKKWKTLIINQDLIAYRVHQNNLTKKRKPLKRLINTTRARIYVRKNLEKRYRNWPHVFRGMLDVLPSRFWK